MMAGVWDEVGFLFDTDDGSLPEVRVTDLTPEGVAAAYAFLRARASVRPDLRFCHKGLGGEERLDGWPNPALLVATDEAEPFHFLAPGLAFDGVALPDLGVFVWPDEAW